MLQDRPFKKEPRLVIIIVICKCCVKKTFKHILSSLEIFLFNASNDNTPFSVLSNTSCYFSWSVAIRIQRKASKAKAIFRKTWLQQVIQGLTLARITENFAEEIIDAKTFFALNCHKKYFRSNIYSRNILAGIMIRNVFSYKIFCSASSTSLFVMVFYPTFHITTLKVLR